MPIKGRSEVRRLPRLGKLRLGIKVEVPGKKFYPKAVDYFVCPPEVQAVFGEKPKELLIMFPVEDEEKFAQQYYRCYSMTRGLICKGDGQMADRTLDKLTGALANRETKETVRREISCPGPNCPEFQKKQCRPIMNLQFLLPQVPGLGVWQLDTSSFYSTVNINSSIELIRGICGRIAMIPLALSLKPTEVTPEGGTKKTVHILHLGSAATLADIQKAALLPPAKALLPAPEPPEEEGAPEDLYPEAVLEEAATPAPREEPPPDKDLFPEDVPAPATPGGPEEARLLWQEIKALRVQANVSNEKVRSWFRKNCELELFPMEVEADVPPAAVTVAMLKRLHLSLKQYQPRLEEKKEKGGSGE